MFAREWWTGDWFDDEVNHERVTKGKRLKSHGCIQLSPVTLKWPFRLPFPSFVLLFNNETWRGVTWRHLDSADGPNHCFCSGGRGGRTPEQEVSFQVGCWLLIQRHKRKREERKKKKKLGKINKWGRFTSKFFILDNIRYRNIIFQPSPRKTCSDFWMVVKNRWIQQKKIIFHRFIKWKRDQFYESMPGIFDWMLLRLFDFVIDLFVYRFGQMLGQFRPIFLHILTVNLEISQGFENFFFYVQ